MKVRFFDIVWDTETDSDELAEVSPPELPLEVEMILPDNAPQENLYSNWDEYLADEGCNVLSDQYGFCVEGCNYEMLSNEA